MGVTLRKPVEYLGYIIKQEKEYLVLYDSGDNQLAKVRNFNHGAYTEIKRLAEYYNRKYRS